MTDPLWLRGLIETSESEASALGASQWKAAVEAMGRDFESVLRVHRGWQNPLRENFLDPADSIPWYRLGYKVRDANLHAAKTLSHVTGGFYLQDAGSLLAPALLGCDEVDCRNSDVFGNLVCDLCAAPGGKATAMLEAIGNGFLLANEPIATRCGPLAQNLERSGSARYAVSRMDPDELANRLGPVFDVVLVDAPCSGQAMIAKGKQSESAHREQMIQANASRQKRILDAAIRLIRPGGLLVYSTCTYAADENEMQIRRLIETAGMMPEPPEDPQRLLDHESAAGVGYRVWPHRHQAAGAFASRLRMPGNVDDHPHQTPSARSKKKRAASGRESRRSEIKPKEFASWGGIIAADTRLFTRGDKAIGFPSDAPEWVEGVASGGPVWAVRSGKTLKPGNAWVWSSGPAPGQSKAPDSAELETEDARFGSAPFAHVDADRIIEIDDDQAAHYVSGQTISVDAEYSGWQIVQWKRRRLGWVKATRGSAKNHFPAARRMNDVRSI